MNWLKVTKARAKIANKLKAQVFKRAFAGVFCLLFILATVVLSSFPPPSYGTSNSVSWTTKGDFENNAVTSGTPTTTSQITVSGSNPSDDANVQVQSSLLASTPNTVDYGSSLLTSNAGSYIYALRADDSNDFWRYSIDDNSWQAMADAPADVWYGAAIVYPGSGDYIYVLRGWNTGIGPDTDFWRYSISANSWQSMASTPAGVGLGSSLTYPGTGDFIYALRGGNESGTDFWRYSISANSWQSMTSTPAEVDYGGSLTYPGSGDYIYALRGNETTDFWRYSISANSWQPMANTPATARNGTSLAYSGSGDYIYALRGNETIDFWRYSISANSWQNRAAIPANVGYGGSLAYPGSGDYLYAFPGESSTDFWRYSISGNYWNNSVARAASIVSNGGSLVYPGSGDYIYAFPGNNTTDFWRYSLSGNSWEARANTPGTVGIPPLGGGALVYPGSGDYIYAFRGGDTTDFWRYSISGDSWEARASAPGNVAYGGSLVYPGSGDYIYAFRGSDTTDFWRYSISGDSWEARAGTPSGVSLGGSLTYPGSGDYLYAFPGANNTDFWRYSISGNSWEARADAPGTVGSGGSLTYPVSGDYIYASSGSDTTDFWRYSISGNSWQARSSAPGTVGSGGSLTYPVSGDYIYAFRGNRTLDFWRYNFSTNTWQTNLTDYLSSGTTANLKINANQEADWKTISWNGTEPANTDIKFRTRGADTEAGLSSASWSNYYTASGSSITTSPSQWLEVELTMETTDGASSATLNDFSVDYETIAVPTVNQPQSLSSSSIRWKLDDNDNNETGFRAYDTSSNLKAQKASANSSYIDETGLSPNTRYTRRLASYNSAIESPKSSTISKYTLPVSPSVISDKNENSSYEDSTFTFTAMFGQGYSDHYHYKWNKNISDIATSSDPSFTGNSPGSVALEATSSGNWYLHLLSHNPEEASGGSETFGPYVYTPPDITPPTFFDLLTPANGSFTNKDRPLFSWEESSDKGSGLDYYELYIDGALNKTVSSLSNSAYPQENLDEGLHTWRVTSVDKAGNSRLSNSTGYFFIDKKAPVTSLKIEPTKPDGNSSWYKSVPQITLSSNEPAKTYYSFDNGRAKEYSTYLNGKEGTYRLYYWSKDLAGNIEPKKSKLVKVDVTAPEISILSPYGGMAKGKLQINATVEDNLKLSKVKLFIDQRLKKEIKSNSVSYQWNTFLDSNANHDIKVIAFDEAGNEKVEIKQMKIANSLLSRISEGIKQAALNAIMLFKKAAIVYALPFALVLMFMFYLSFQRLADWGSAKLN